MRTPLFWPAAKGLDEGRGGEKSLHFNHTGNHKLHVCM